MMNPQGIRGVVFDMDGVLVETTDCHRAAFEQIFQTFGIHEFAYSRYAGRRTAEVIQEVLMTAGRHELPEVIESAAREKSRLAREMFEHRRPVAPECEGVLAELAADYPLALASSGSRASVDAFLRLTGSASLFTSILSGEEVVAAKPDPEIYRRSAERLGLEISQCLVVEDAESGVEAARAAGASVAGIPGTCSEEQLKRSGAGYIVSSLRELAALLSPRRPSQIGPNDTGPNQADTNQAGPHRVGPGQLDPAQWTAVIPAAGRGSRLGFNHPKILYPVGGRPILAWLLDLFVPNCSRLVFVLSPDGASEVSAELERRIPGRFDVVIQDTPTGMGDAVALGLSRVRTPDTAVVWGDQVALRRESVETCMRLHQGVLRPDVTFPTVLRTQPYIHFDRDTEGRITGLRQAREGAAMPETGESDAGFFCFASAKLGTWLKQIRASESASGTLTREFNLLPVIPWAARDGRVLTPRVIRLEETVGVNSVRDATEAEEFLRGSRAFGI